MAQDVTVGGHEKYAILIYRDTRKRFIGQIHVVQRIGGIAVCVRDLHSAFAVEGGNPKSVIITQGCIQSTDSVGGIGRATHQRDLGVDDCALIDQFKGSRDMASGRNIRRHATCAGGRVDQIRSVAEGVLQNIARLRRHGHIGGSSPVPGRQAGKRSWNSEPPGVRQFRFGQIADIDIPVELSSAIGFVDQMQRSRATAPVDEGTVVSISVVANENQVTSDGALWFGVLGNLPEEAVMDVCEIRRHGHTQTSRVGQEDALLTIEGQSAADLILDVELSQIAAPNRALNFRNR